MAADSEEVRSVLAVCPNLEPEKVRQDLEMTGSVTRTINRVFEGQFLSGSPHYSPVPAQDYSSLSSRPRPVVQELSDSDDDDLVIGDGNLAKERKTSFTALKARFDSINQGTNRPVLETCDGLSGQHVDQICEPGNALASFSEDESECSRKRRVTIDLSQSSEDDELPGLSDVRKKRNIRGTCTESSENVIIVNDDGRLFSGKNVRFSGTARLKNCVSGDASDTGYYISSGESDGDMPCMLPSVLRGTSTNTSAIYSSKSASSEETSEGFRAEPVPKKKRRSPEEVALARQNALMQREARERERQAKKEAKEAEKSEKQQSALMKRMEKETEKLAKKAQCLTQKTQQRRDCVKHMQVCIDPHLIADAGEENDTCLLQQLVELGASYSIEPQPETRAVTWKRATVEHSVGDHLQISSKTTHTEEDVAAVCIAVEQFVEMVFSHKHGGESFVSFCEKVRRLFPDKSLTIAIMGMEKYFRGVKAKQQRQYREQVRGASGSDNEKSTSKGKKRAARETGASLVVSRLDVEQALVEQQLEVGCNVRMCETAQELASYVTMTTKAVAEAPHKRAQPDAFSFCTEGSGKGSVKISRDGQGLTKAWQRQLQQFRNVSADMAAAIVAEYPSVQSLVQAYERCRTHEQAAKLLQDILVRRGTGVLASTRRIGPELSRRVFTQFRSMEGAVLLK